MFEGEQIMTWFSVLGELFFSCCFFFKGNNSIFSPKNVKTILSQIMTRFTSHACHAFLSDGDTLPLSQPQSAHGTLVGGSSCPGTPEMRRRQEEVLRRLASQVPTNTNIISLPFNLIFYRCIISVSQGSLLFITYTIIQGIISSEM